MAEQNREKLISLDNEMCIRDRLIYALNTGAGPVSAVSNAFTIMADEFSASMIAVSYTHLDVYKRQTLTCRRTRALMAHRAAMTAGSMRHRTRQTMTPVSYTHLSFLKPKRTESRRP